MPISACIFCQISDVLFAMTKQTLDKLLYLDIY